MNFFSKCRFVLLFVCMLMLSSCGGVDAKETINDLSLTNVNATKNDEFYVGEAFGLEFSNLSEDEIKNILNDNKKTIENRVIDVVGADVTTAMGLNEIMYKIDVNKTCDNILNGVTQPEVFTFDSLLLSEKSEEIKDINLIEPENATMIREDGEFKIISGIKGRSYNEEEFNESIQQVFLNKSDKIVLSYEEVEPKYNAEVFKESQDLLGTATSNYSVYATSRNINLAQASSNINGVVLYPGDIFSTNELFGETTIENGYSLASVIVNNELVDGLGGGVCQISSTLYNAVLHSEIEVLERRNHSLKVSYMDYGFDATLANPYIDFKFKNNTEYPIYVEAGIDEGKAFVSIYGKETRDPSREIKFYNVFLGSVAASEQIIEDNTLPAGQVIREITPLNGVKYAVYKDVYENGVKVDTVEINVSNYTPRNGKTIVGTKEVEEEIITIPEGNEIIDNHDTPEEPQTPQETPAPQIPQEPSETIPSENTPEPVIPSPDVNVESESVPIIIETPEVVEETIVIPEFEE